MKCTPRSREREEYMLKGDFKIYKVLENVLICSCCLMITNHIAQLKRDDGVVANAKIPKHLCINHKNSFVWGKELTYV